MTSRPGCGRLGPLSGTPWLAEEVWTMSERDSTGTAPHRVLDTLDLTARTIDPS